MNTQDKKWQAIVTNLMKMSTESVPGWLDGQIHGVGEIKAGKRVSLGDKWMWAEEGLFISAISFAAK